MNPEYKTLTHIPKFRGMVLQNFPYIEEDFDALTDYAFMSKIVEYLNNVIEQQNLVNDNTDVLHQAYIELKNYVDNYFTNLDVQEEINNKLEDMAESGELTLLIKNYVDPFINAQNQEISNFKNTINNEVNNQNSQINVLEGRMDEFASLTEGSTTGDAELADIRVGQNGITYNTAGNAVRGQFAQVYNNFNDNLGNINLNNYISTNYWISTGTSAGVGGDNTSIVLNVSSMTGKLIINTSVTQARYRVGLCSSDQFAALTGTPSEIQYANHYDNTKNQMIVNVTDADYLIINVTDITKISINKEFNYTDDYKAINKSQILRYNGDIFHHGRLNTEHLQADGYYNVGDANGKTSNPIAVLAGDTLIVHNLVYNVTSSNIYVLFTDSKGYIISYDVTNSANYNSNYMEITVPAGATRVFFSCNNGANLDQITITRIVNKELYYLENPVNKPKNFIIDTDLASDVDDVMALRICSWAERNNLINLMGMILSCNGTQEVSGVTYYSKICADSLFQYDGLKNVKMGCQKNKPMTSRYYKDVTDNFYHTLTGNNNALSGAANVYRRMLASIPDGEKCTICIVGYLTPFSELLNVESDAYSSLSGIELVEAKVDKVYIMGGTYPSSSIIETNFSDVTATNNVLTNCPVPMVFLGNEWEVIQAGQSLIADNKTYDPVYVALHEYWTSRDGHDSIKPRMAWDPLTALLAIIGNEDLGMSLVQGTNSINTDSSSPNYGFNTFTASNSGKDYYVTKRYDNKFYQDAINDILDKKAWFYKK